MTPRLSRVLLRRALDVGRLRQSPVCRQWPPEAVPIAGTQEAARPTHPRSFQACVKSGSPSGRSVGCLAMARSQDRCEVSRVRGSLDFQVRLAGDYMPFRTAQQVCRSARVRASGQRPRWHPRVRKGTPGYPHLAASPRPSGRDMPATFPSSRAGLRRLAPRKSVAEEPSARSRHRPAPSGGRL